MLQQTQEQRRLQGSHRTEREASLPLHPALIVREVR